MTPAEYRATVEDAEDLDWWKTKVTTIELPHLDFYKEFSGILSAYEFIYDQVIKWGKIESEHKFIAQSQRMIDQVQNGFIILLDYVSESGSLNNRYNQLIRNQLNHLTANKFFLADCPETKFLLDPKVISIGNIFDGAKSFFSNEIVGLRSVNDINTFKGILMAYEFNTKGDSLITERKNKEKASLNELRDSYFKYINEGEQRIDTTIQNGVQNFSDSLSSFERNSQDQREAYQAWIDSSQGQFNNFENQSKSRIEELEKTYEEKLKLEKPGAYWKERGQQMQQQAWIALASLVLLVGSAAYALYLILWGVPEAIFTSFLADDKSAAIRWSIIFIAFLSFIAFGIRALAKVMFSSFHLARDAQERYTLTYFYLSLLKDASVDKEDRKLIMQSLFSRSDTGLLKEDSSPTMPSDITKLIK